MKVSSKSRHYVHFNVKAGDMFIWEFATKKKDIGFGKLKSCLNGLIINELGLEKSCKCWNFHSFAVHSNLNSPLEALLPRPL